MGRRVIHTRSKLWVRFCCQLLPNKIKLITHMRPFLLTIQGIVACTFGEYCHHSLGLSHSQQNPIRKQALSV